MPTRYFNWKLAIVLLMGLVVLGVGAYGLRRWNTSNRSEHALVLGNEAYDQHRWEDAAEQLGRYLIAEREDVPVLLKYADAQLKVRPTKQNRVQQAIAAYRTILRVDQNNSEAAKELIEIYLGIGSPGEAELIVRRQLETGRNPEFQRMLALALIGQRRFKEAAAELKSVLQEDPGQVSSYETLGLLTEQRPGDFTETAASWYDKAVQNNPSLALAYIARAGFHRRSGAAAQALADLRRAQSLELSDPKARLRLAAELMESDSLDKAEEHLAAIQEAMPEDQSLWRTWAVLALRSKSKEKMLKVAKTGLQALSAQPWDFMSSAAELYIRCGEFADANDCLSQMHEKSIAPAAVEFLRGLAASEQGDLSEAARYWRRSMDLGNKSEQVRLNLASALSHLGDTQSAIRQVRTLVSERPDSFDGHLILAKLLAQTGSWLDVSDHAAKAMNLSPGNPEAVMLHLQAQMQILSTDSGGTNSQLRQDVQRQLSLLEKADDSTGEIKLMRFQFMLGQRMYAEAAALLDQLKETPLPRAKIAVAQAELLIAQDKVDEAIPGLKETAKESPESATVTRYLAILLDQQGKQNECETVIKASLAQIEEPLAHRQLGVLLAQFYIRWGRGDDAHSLLSTLERKLPGDIPVKRQLLSCEQVVKDPQRAQQIVDQIKSVEGEDGWQWRYEQARVWFAANDFKSRYPQIISLLQENVLANPSDQASRLLLAMSYQRAGEKQLSLSTYREALGRSPDDLRIVIPTVAALYNAKEYDEAERILQRAGRQNLHHPELQKLQLQSSLRRGELNSASDILQDLLSNDPNNQNAFLSLALLKVQQGEFDEASELLTTLKAKDPDSLPVTAAQIQLSIHRDRPAEALQLSDEMVNRLNNASAHILRARAYASLGQREAAIKDLDHAVTAEPDNVEVWVARSDFYRYAGQPEKAVADIRRALSLAPDDLGIQMRAIALFLASGEPSSLREGKALLAKALESNPNDIGLQLLNARAMLAEGTVQAISDAMVVLQKLTDEQPETTEAWVLLGEIALKQGQHGKAMEAALGGLSYRPTNKTLLLLKARSEAARSPVLAVPTLEVLHKLDPNDIDTAVLLANTYIKAGGPRRAVDLLQRQLKVCDASTRRKCEVALAVATYKDGNRGKGQKDLDSLLESDPNDPSPLLAHVELLKDDKLWSQLSQKVIGRYRARPGDPYTPVRIARDLMTSQDSQARSAAEDVLRAILRDDPDCAEAMSVLALLLQIVGRPAESAEIYQRLLAVEPDNLIAINNLAWIMCEQEGQPQRALELADRGLKMNPKYLDLIDTRGVVYYRLGEFDNAIRDFSECIKRYPATTPAGVAAHFHLGRAFAKSGENSKAVEHLNKALDMQNRIGGLSTADVAEAQRLLKQLEEGN